MNVFEPALAFRLKIACVRSPDLRRALDFSKFGTEIKLHWRRSGYVDRCVCVLFFCVQMRMDES